jgi:hypothetical protein
MDPILKRLGQPLAEFDGEHVFRLRAPIVYVWLRGEKALYVGSGASGIARPFLHCHHRLRGMLATDRLVIWACQSRSEALNLEARLVDTLRPKFNTAERAKATRAWGTAHNVYRDWRDPTTWVLEFEFRGIRYRKSLGRVTHAKALQLGFKYKQTIIDRKTRDTRMKIPKGMPKPRRRLRTGSVILPDASPRIELEITPAADAVPGSPTGAASD